MTPSGPFAGLVLAAGGGRRFGGPKALVRYDDELLVDRATRTLADAGCAPVVVVLGAEAQRVVAEAGLEGCVTLVNEGWKDGMGSSLRCGLSALADLHAAAVTVTLVDTPDVTADAVRRLHASWQDGAVAVVATYGGEPGHPVVLDTSVWADVATAAVADTGARAWLREHPDVVVEVACDDLGRHDDIDTPGDLTRLQEDSE
jgi:CTP:molybdopterin cytidylyltransferase MocA